MRLVFLDYLLRSVVNLLVIVPWLSLGIVVGLVNRRAGASVIFSGVRFFLRLFRVDVVVLVGLRCVYQFAC